MTDQDEDLIEAKLRTDGNDIIFHFRKEKYPDQALLRITIENQSNVGQQKIESIEDIVERKEIVKLCEYLKNYIEKIKENRDYESHRYLDDSLLYTIQAIGGVWIDEGEGYARFSLLFLVNVGRSDSKKRVWMGSETGVDSREIIRFCNRITK